MRHIAAGVTLLASGLVVIPAQADEFDQADLDRWQQEYMRKYRFL
jgi:hypothetical protein